MTDNGYLLVVDDEADVRFSETMLLEEAGYRVIDASSAIDALRVIREYGPPLACVTDVAMPNLSGIDLARVIRSRGDTADLPMVLVSARVLPSDVAAANALGASYVMKPFTCSTVLDALDVEISAGARRSASRRELCSVA